jgi:broad specificity phosphatase PhoE
VAHGNIIAYFGRHGSTSANDAGLFRGATDYPLDAHGVEDAISMRNFFTGTELGQAWTSGMKRTDQTAEIVLAGRGIEPYREVGLKPIDVGDLAGEKKSDYREEVNWLQGHPNIKFPGGESINQFSKRVQPHIKRVIMAGIHSPHPTIGLVHASTIHEIGNMIHQNHNAVLVKPGGVVAVHFDGQKFHAEPVFRGKKESTGYAS